MNYTIRKAKASDIEEIIQLCIEHAVYEEAEYFPIGKAEKLANYLFSSEPRLFCLIAESEGKAIGYATYMFEFSTWEAEFYAHMDCLYLQEHARGLGIGEELVKEIAKAAKEKGCVLIQWQTPVFNTRAIKFYHRMGASSKEKVRLYLDDKAMNNLIQKS